MDLAAAASAFRAIFERSMDLSPGNELLIIHDESFDKFMPAAELAIEQAALYCVCTRITRVQQERAVKDLARSAHEFLRLPGALEVAISTSSSILNVLGPELHTSAYRKAVLQARSNTGRIAHVPGISEEVLRVMLETPVGVVEQACDTLAWALGQAHEAVIHTSDRSGRLHELKMSLGGWRNEPLMSPGVIASGSWGNIPPGEVFCCPRPESVEGSICINGSVPNLAFAEDEEVILRFKRGKFEWECPRDSRIDQFFSAERNRAESLADVHWDTFAELGIGLNPAIKKLTGNSLFDEKAAKTLHIAVGDNSVFGHNVVAKTHADLVTYRPTLILDGHVVLRDGVTLLEDIDQRRVEFFPNDNGLTAKSLIEIVEQRCHLREGRLCRKLTSGNRIGYVELGPKDLTAKLGSLYQVLKIFGNESLEVICRDHPNFEGTDTADLIRILHHYNVVKITTRRGVER